MISPDIKLIYDKYIAEENRLNNEERYAGNEKFYHASSAGGCSRKLYYETVTTEEPTNLPSPESFRKMRLGTVFHNEMENCFNHYNKTENKYIYNIPSNSTSTNNNNIYNYTVHQEKEIIIEELNVRGYYDLVLVNDKTESVYLYDFKTIGSYPYKLKFGRDKKPNKNKRYELQLGTYGIAVAKEFGTLSGMFLIYYNKDTSAMKQVTVPMLYVDKARKFWEEIGKSHLESIPKKDNVTSPVESWECNYCNFKNLCLNNTNCNG